MNKYDILGISGEGAYGVVLKCRNKETNATVAIKKFKDLDDPEDTAFRKTTLREIKLLKNCIHPYIVRLLEAFKRKQRLYLVFEFCDYTVLEMIEKSKNGIGIKQVKQITYQMIKSVEYLHQNRIIHRDLKPENLLMTSKNILKLCDFGFARHINSTSGKDYQPQDMTDYVATRWYRAPELLLNTTDYNYSVDVWAIALIIVEMITSQPLFPGDSDVDQLYLIQKVLGNLTRKQMEKFLRNPKFVGIKMPDLQGRVEGLERRLAGKIKDQDLLQMLINMLKMEPNERISCSTCLDSPWFDEVRQVMSNQEKELWKELGIESKQQKQRSPTPSQVTPVIGQLDPEELPQLPNSRTGSRTKIRQQTDPNISFQLQNYGFGSSQKTTEVRLPNIPRHK
ncbi:Kinase, CMGC CDKL [Spironucleus salmonicida]|uniref:cyclin-dependent kinase n=1 Tax=Spironucleus salmonicida TaxID=348837 RepID=V6LRH6_9EUKA|nr:Kinase, CMGC CDKL [Spironucleus salmonicida]|eukprot:EST47257.1 Kinase, CMGC CDKL [Spironucleus salmonicida]